VEAQPSIPTFADHSGLKPELTSSINAVAPRAENSEHPVAIVCVGIQNASQMHSSKTTPNRSGRSIVEITSVRLALARIADESRID
jgi:hypothetical protein